MAGGKVRAVLLDLGGTLVDGDRVLPSVPEALTALTRFRTAAGSPLELAVVSDFPMPPPPGDAAAVEALVREYLALLDGFGLRRFFEPVERRVTLSTQVGVRKPDRRVYETALRRLGTGADLTEALAITEDAGHLAACRALGMATVQVAPARPVGEGPRTGGPAPGVVDDWLDVPLLVRRLVAPEDVVTTAEALRPWLAARDAELLAVEGPAGAGITATAAIVTLRVQRGNPDARTVRSTVTFDETGRVADLVPDTPGGPEDEELAAMLRSLRASGQLGVGSGPLPSGVTHVESVDAEGRLVARRRRFSAL